MNYFSWKRLTAAPFASSINVLVLVTTLLQAKVGLAQVDVESQSSFKVVSGKKLSSGVTQIQTITRQGLTLQQCTILCRLECGMFEYSSKDSRCNLYKERNYDFGVVVSNDVDWTWVHKRRHKTVTKDGWTLVFRAQAKIGVSAYETWNDTEATTDNPVEDSFPFACLRSVQYTSCDRHFRSHIIDNWENIDKVRFSLLNNDVEVVYILFDGEGSNSSSWFSQDRIISSTWPALRMDTLVDQFDLFGYRQVPKLWRSFLIFGPKVVCNLDKFYHMVIDQSTDSCAIPLFWDITVTGFPSFYYSTDVGMANLYTLFSPDKNAQAEVLTISVTFL